MATVTLLPEKRVAPRHLWAVIKRLSATRDTRQIAFFLGLTESQVYNALALMDAEAGK